MTNHSLISASRNTHAKIAALAVAVSLVFVAVVSSAGVTRTDSTPTHAYGAVVKAKTLISVAGSGTSTVR